MQKKYQIFISSTYIDLIEERQKVQDAILSLYHFPIGMEMFSAADEEQWKIIQETIDSSDYYILIIGHRYGSIIEEGSDAGISYTQKEFRYAKSKGIPILAFFADRSVPIDSKYLESDAAREKLDDFKDEVSHKRHIRTWYNSDDLKAKVLSALHMQFQRDAEHNKNRPGWVRNVKQGKNDNQFLYSLATNPEQEFSKKIRDALRVTIIVRTGVNIINQYESAIKESMRKGCKYRFLAYDYGKEAPMIYSEHSKKNHDTAYAMFIEFCQKYPSLEYRETSIWPNCSIMYVEFEQDTKNYIQVQLYPQTMKGSERPMFRINQGDAWYHKFLEEVETLWKEAQEGRPEKKSDDVEVNCDSQVKPTSIEKPKESRIRTKNVPDQVAGSMKVEGPKESRIRTKNVPDQVVGSVKIGDRVRFGKYPQGENGEVEPLVWRVLAVEPGRALLITEKLIDVKKYNRSSYQSSIGEVRWVSCTLRKWLNKEGKIGFIGSAFSEKERLQIDLTHNNNPDNPKYGTVGGGDTEDKVFLLSIDEARKYFQNDADRMAIVTPYAVKKGAFTYGKAKLQNGEQTGWWWLRSPGGDGDYAAFVIVAGGVSESGYNVDDTSVSVRPALWLNL